MELLLAGQSALLNVSPGLMPLAAILYSILNSWHCSVMCGPLAYAPSRDQLHRFLLTRLIGYTTLGGLFGYLGQVLKDSLEIQLVSALAFAALVVLTLAFVIPQLIPGVPRLKLNRVAPSARGGILAFLPCHLLAFYYGIAALTGSPAWGAGLLFAHAVMTTPALAYAWRFTARSAHAARFMRYALIVMIGLNLFYFAGHLFHPAEEVARRILFCF